MLRRSIVIAAVAAAAVTQPTDARACGCFAQPSPATPVVQAGERILFAHEGDQVIAYIQIQYQGAADQFGWLVPLPSVPTLEVGTDELFSTLDSTTLPRYQLTRTRQFCGGGSTSSVSSGGDGCGALGFGGDDTTANGGSDMNVAAAHDMGAANPIVVEQASIGPYDYAVLKADDESAMLQWLSDNRYFVPAGTSEAAKPYIHPGAYFLALKLKGGQSAGDVTPIVLRYTSDLPMIPITLTQVGAVENMGILVWVLGEARAIPRNYYHVVVDDLPIWFSNVTNYNLGLINAVHDAPGKHGFITQYAGTSGIVRNLLDSPSRFGNLDTLRTLTLPQDYVRYLRNNGYSFDGTLFSILERYIPEPPALVAKGIRPAQFYLNLDSYVSYLPGNDSDGGATMPFDPAACTDEISARIVVPMRDAQQLFLRHPYLTRLYTALSPKDMTIDPVFSSNRDLPNVPLLHAATVTTPCNGDSWLATDEGFEAQYPNGLPPSPNVPASLRVELIRDAGAPELVIDNRAAISAALGPVSHGQPTSGGKSSQDGGGNGCGCTVGRMRVHTNVAMLFALAALALGVRSLRRRRS